MARLIRHDATGPVRVDPGPKPVFICACGLTRNAPFCDGSHAKTRSEEPSKLYVYDDERQSVVEERVDDGAPPSPR